MIYKRNLDVLNFTLSGGMLEKKEIFRGSIKAFVLDSLVDPNEVLSEADYETCQKYIENDFRADASLLTAKALTKAGWDIANLEAQLKAYIEFNTDRFTSSDYVVHVARPVVNGECYVVALIYPGNSGEVVAESYELGDFLEDRLIPEEYTMKSRSLWGTIVDFIRA